MMSLMIPVAEIQFPSFDPVAFSVGPLAIRWYGLAYMVGIGFSLFYIKKLITNPSLWAGKKPTVGRIQIDDFFLWAVIGVVLGGRLGYVLFYQPQAYFEEPLAILRLWEGGMSFHGGFFGVILAAYFYSRKIGVDFIALLDLGAASVPIGLGLGRLANFINGELYGRPTNVEWAMRFPTDPFFLPRHPSQLYEAFLEGVVLFILIFLATHRYQALSKTGMAAGLFAFFYGVFRIFIENFREPDAFLGYFLGFVTMGMILCIPMIMVGVWLLWRARSNRLEFENVTRHDT